jgi:hypothetical protein
MSNFQGQNANGLPSSKITGYQNILVERLGELPVSQWLPKYAAGNWTGFLYTIGHTAAQALSVNSTTFTGLAVANPAASGKNLVIVDASVAVAAVLANVAMVPRLGYAAIVALTQGNASSTKGLPALVGTSGGSVALCGASASLTAAPTTLRPLAGLQWVTGAGGAGAQLYAKDEVAGAIIIPPGQMLTLDALVAACSVIGSFSWLELPI